MRVIFAGTPEFAALALKALINAGHDIPLVLTQPDRPAGRGMKLKMSPVKEVALAHGIAVAQPENLKTEAARQPILDAQAEVMVVAAYGLILPQTVLDMPPLGCINIHASLLPRWRGAAPIHRAIEAGDVETGITLMQMDKGLDTGAMLARSALLILPDDTTGSLHDRLAELGAREIVRLLPELAAAKIEATAQDDTLATYAAKIGKEEARLDWRMNAAELDRKIRAFNPFPGAYGLLDGAVLKIWQANPVAGSVASSVQPGSILAATSEALLVACGEGALAITQVQQAGGKRLPISAFLAGNSIKQGNWLR
jgi:methionyl-tRNA formyltransferase